jgi:hypothetical protein
MSGAAGSTVVSEATAGQPARRVSRRRLAELSARLGLADFDILGLLGQHRFLTTGHVAGLVFGGAASRLAGVRAAQRALRKLESQGSVTMLPRRVGGYGGGAAQSVWRLTEAGHRLLRLQAQGGEGRDRLGGIDGGGRRRVRFVEPSAQFLAHTLRVADIRLVFERLETDSGGKAELSQVQTEPECWRNWVGPHGAPMTLRPDLYVETTSDEYMDCWFVEVDMGTEHLPAVARKARAYEAYRLCGREQAARGVFPLVLWVTPDERRAEAIMAAIDSDPGCDVRPHRAACFDWLAELLAGGGQVTGLPGVNGDQEGDRQSSKERRNL